MADPGEPNLTIFVSKIELLTSRISDYPTIYKPPRLASESMVGLNLFDYDQNFVPPW